MPPLWLQVLCVRGRARVRLGGLDPGGCLRPGHRQRMPVMEAVWPVTGLYFGPPTVWAYNRFGRPQTSRWLAEHNREEAPDKPGWASTAVGVSHCGAGCTLGDIVAEFVVFAVAATIAGEALYPEYIGDYLAAVSLGSYSSTSRSPATRGSGVGKGLIEAVKVDIL